MATLNDLNKLDTLHGSHSATLIHGLTGRPVSDCKLPDGLEVVVEGIWGPSQPDPFFADHEYALAISQDDGCRYRIQNPRFR